MSLTETLNADALFRAAAEQKALRLEAMTGAEIASLSDEKLKDLHRVAGMARMYEECSDAAHTSSDPYWERVRRYRELENKASVEMKARGERRAA